MKHDDTTSFRDSSNASSRNCMCARIDKNTNMPNKHFKMNEKTVLNEFYYGIIIASAELINQMQKKE